MQGPEPLELSVDHVGASTVVGVAGEIDLATAPQFEAFLRDQLAHTHAVFMLDLSGVNYLGSAGLDVLLRVRAECDRRGVDLVFGECSFIVRRVFEVSGLTGYFLRGESATG
ncbi:STAS domain-containing protein [Lentzea flava]|uniref:Anti-sigma factor antagonist n=1 Tax=Lentzea flava TaxID=103732 RepID=A0ABQ2UGQ6_9PSEU|nr:STAS domain-containing protein [Lentzea flava]MCP2199222.1 anti-anti-sigma factor [Lentzea flava]GGU33667.1 anti-sigma factor antagonist [Lentzea flava]